MAYLVVQSLESLVILKPGDVGPFGWVTADASRDRVGLKWILLRRYPAPSCRAPGRSSRADQATSILPDYKLLATLSYLALPCLPNNEGLLSETSKVPLSSAIHLCSIRNFVFLDAQRNPFFGSASRRHFLAFFLQHISPLFSSVEVEFSHTVDQVPPPPLPPQFHEHAGPTPTPQTSERSQAAENSVDVERECGVPLREGRRCGGSLACKRHSMGSKRAVAGRSAPYDQLLAAFMERRRAERASEESV
ncbi:SCA7, zinc-binding domain-containing protein [Colletotrichum acutatum]|uniref:SCA7, zinc-binding domain-containing protein n=1 Tax=Glomerella acutata TaxID=27357 RepID=A0AAD9D3Y4_GLOAC|nr:SCA7, zinc-binding domain-containing protein [Colletotrichum acutatum]KAK1731966.1 SCA7, zinc-binding domain-containing protein [Colletotrichum acutatum]